MYTNIIIYFEKLRFTVDTERNNFVFKYTSYFKIIYKNFYLWFQNIENLNPPKENNSFVNLED